MDETIPETTTENETGYETTQEKSGGNWLDRFTGHRVTVITLQGTEERTDPGALLRIADGWVQLVKDNGEMILIPTTAIRIIKLLDMTQTTNGLPLPMTNQTVIDNHIYEPHAQLP
jgi:hypothetical protein